MWKRERTWSRIRRILELEQQVTILKDTNYRLRMELLVTKNKLVALNELLQKAQQGRQTWPDADLEWRYNNVTRKPSPASGAARKGTEEVTEGVTEGVTEQTEEGAKGTA